MPIVEPDAMWVGEPLPGWQGRYFHSATMTFSLYAIATGAKPLHEHFHPEEEVWNVVEGEIALSIDGVEHVLRAGSAAIVPPNTRHSARPIGACRVVVTDHPVRTQLPGSPRLMR